MCVNRCVILSPAVTDWLSSVLCLQHVPLLSETLRMLATNDLSAAAYPYAAGSQVSSQGLTGPLLS